MGVGRARRRMARGACALALVAGVAGGGSSGVGWAGAGDQLWEARYNGPGNSDDLATSLAPSPDGTRVFVTGRSYDFGTHDNGYSTIAYDALSGVQLWAARYNAPGNSDDWPTSLAVSPEGTRVFVTGVSCGTGLYCDYATIAYNAASGAQLWDVRYNGPAHSDDQAHSLSVSPDGTRVFVTGWSWDSGTGADYATVAYVASSGAQLWAARYNGPWDGFDEAMSVAVSPDGTRVFVTGGSAGSVINLDYATVAYDAASGAQLWAARYNGLGNSFDRATSVTSSPDSARVFLTGVSSGSGTGYDYATIAYDAQSGAKLWEARYNGPANSDDWPTSVAVSPDGARVFVTGWSLVTGLNYDYATIAYDALSGAQLWAACYNGRGSVIDQAASVASTGAGLWAACYDHPGGSHDSAYSLAPSPDGARLFVTGESDGDYTTIAYDTSSGVTLWEARYSGPGGQGDGATSLAASPDGTRVFVTGWSYRSGTDYDYATIAYDTAICASGAYEDGRVSGPVHGTVEPASGDLRSTVHQVNCNVVAANGL